LERRRLRLAVEVVVYTDADEVAARPGIDRLGYRAHLVSVAAQIKVHILGLGGPLVGEGEFHADTRRPAELPIRGGDRRRQRDRNWGNTDHYDRCSRVER